METLKNLKGYLENTSQEQFDKDWNEALGKVSEGPTVDEIVSDMISVVKIHFDLSTSLTKCGKMCFVCSCENIIFN